MISQKLSDFDILIQTGEVVLLFSNESLNEFIEVVKRPKFVNIFQEKDVEKLFHSFDEYGELIEVTSNLHICRDEKDNFLLNLSVDGKADYLVTGDKDLLVVGKIEKTQILTYQEFQKIF